MKRCSRQKWLVKSQQDKADAAVTSPTALVRIQTTNFGPSCSRTQELIENCFRVSGELPAQYTRICFFLELRPLLSVEKDATGDHRPSSIGERYRDFGASTLKIKPHMRDSLIAILLSGLALICPLLFD
jgi:hypothetical protein